MRYWVHHLGIPLGSADFPPGELAVGEFEPAVAYDSVRSMIRDASATLWRMGFFGSEALPRVSADALGRVAALKLDLYDENANEVPADFVNIIERPRAADGAIAIARFRLSHGHVPSVPPLRQSRPGKDSIPDA